MSEWRRFLHGLNPTYWLTGRRVQREHREPGRPSDRIPLPVLAVGDVASWFWCVGVRNPIAHNYFTLRYWWHSGDTTSRWWSPAPGEPATDCRGRTGLVIGVWLRYGEARLVYPDHPGEVPQTWLWESCVSPVLDEVSRRRRGPRTLTGKGTEMGHEQHHAA